MFRSVFAPFRWALLGLTSALAQPLVAAPIPVEVVESHGHFLLLRGGEPYVVKGVGGGDRLAELAAIGGNSIRTWGDVSRDFLDAAHAHGLSVAVGLWIEHERHGFDYGDEAAVAAQIAKHTAKIDELKDHPAVLLWGIGNEVELNYTDRRVWDTIEAVAAHAHAVDPHHPTMAVTAHLNPEATAQIKRRAPSIDILGINSYKGLRVIPEAVREHWREPYLVTEWGTDGGWESPETAWGAELEATSTEKAIMRMRRHGVFSVDRQYCLGGYAFLWGDKIELTPTWFGMFTPDGAATEEVEVMSYLWSGEFPEDRAPRISPLTLDGHQAADSLTVTPAQHLMGSFELWSPQDNVSHVRWEIRPESTDKRMGGDAEELPTMMPTDFLQPALTDVAFAAPTVPGPYRLYLFCYGAEGRTVATANLPFLVE